MGRKSKLDGVTEEQLETFMLALEKGLPQKLAAELIGQSPDTVRGWIARGKNGDEQFADFYRTAKQRDAAGFQNYWSKLMTMIDSAEPRDALKGVLWIMERRYGMTLKAAELDTLAGPTEARSVVINIIPPPDHDPAIDRPET